MNRIAIISDIHGNLEALKTVISDIKERHIDKIICLGDIIAKGTHSHECIQIIKQNCDVVIKGNCDDYFSRNIDMLNEKDIQTKRIEWNNNKLSIEDKKYLQELPYCYEFYLSGRLVRLFHATPDKINGFVGNIDKLDNLYKLFLPSSETISDNKADVVIYGHIHTQFMQRIYNRTIVNAGSVGNSIDVFRNDLKDGDKRNTTVANYVIISGIYGSKDINNNISYELISVHYDLDKELMENTDNIEFESYEKEIKDGKYRDMNKIYDSFVTRGIDKNKI